MNSKTLNPSLMLIALACLILGTSTARGTPMQEIALGIQRATPVDHTPWDFSSEYRVGTDFNRPERPRSFEHQLLVGVSRKFFKDYTISAESGVKYWTLDNAVVRDNPKDQYYEWSDIGLSALRVFKTQDMKHSLAVMVGQDFLVSEQSRYLGYRSVTGARAIHSWSVLPKLSIKQSLDGGYILNRYRFAPVAMGPNIREGHVMSDGYYGYSIGPIITLLKGLRLGANVAVRGNHFLDGSQTFGFGNSYSLTYSRDKWSAYARYVNRGYAERGETDLWFVDKYRSLASAGFIYNF